jgi:hypothetical protein
MPVSDADFEKLAQNLESDYSDEISRRCAISRLYYGCFHKIRQDGDQDKQSNFSFGSGGNDHKEVQDWLRRKGQKKLAQKVHSLHNKRKDADYELGKNIDGIDLNKAKSDANIIRQQFQYININRP